MPSVRHPNAADWWPLIGPHLFKDLPRDSAESVREPVLSLLRLLPPDALLAFELPLIQDPVHPRLPDVSLRLTCFEHADHVMAHWPSADWTDLVSRWAHARTTGEGTVLAAARSLWLEFDLRRTTRPRPLLCLRLPEACGDLGPWVELLHGGAGRAAQIPALERCRLALPPGACAMYLFDLSAREAGSLRLELAGISFADMVPYLRRINAPIPEWVLRLGPLFTSSDRPHLSFDLRADGSIDDRIGIETSYVRLPHREPRWSLLFDTLVHESLCDARTREAFMAWPGQAQRATAEHWPSSPELADGHVARVLSHVKLAGRLADTLPEAKGYLLFQYLKP